MGSQRRRRPAPSQGDRTGTHIPASVHDGDSVPEGCPGHVVVAVARRRQSPRASNASPDSGPSTLTHAGWGLVHPFGRFSHPEVTRRGAGDSHGASRGGWVVGGSPDVAAPRSPIELGRRTEVGGVDTPHAMTSRRVESPLASLRTSDPCERVEVAAHLPRAPELDTAQPLAGNVLALHPQLTRAPAGRGRPQPACALASAFLAFLEARAVATGGCRGPRCIYLHKRESSR